MVKVETISAIVPHIILYAAVLTVQFDATEYVVNEGDDGVFRLVLNLQADRNVSVLLTTLENGR